MLISNTANDPADRNVVIFRQFISLAGFTDSRETVTHIAIETVTNIRINSVDMLTPPLD
jgi:hypothetical protein